MHTDRDARHRLQIFRIQQDTGNLQCVDHVTCREGEGKVLIYVLLVVVGDGVGEVDRIGGILPQRIGQLDDGLASGGTDHRHLLLGRSDNHLLGGLFDLDQLVKDNLDLLSLVVCLVGQRCAADKFGRQFVVGPAIGRSDVGTGCQQQQESAQGPFCPYL